MIESTFEEIKIIISFDPNFNPFKSNSNSHNIFPALLPLFFSSKFQIIFPTFPSFFFQFPPFLSLWKNLVPKSANDFPSPLCHSRGDVGHWPSPSPPSALMNSNFMPNSYFDFEQRMGLGGGGIEGKCFLGQNGMQITGQKDEAVLDSTLLENIQQF